MPVHGAEGEGGPLRIPGAAEEAVLVAYSWVWRNVDHMAFRLEYDAAVVVVLLLMVLVLMMLMMMMAWPPDTYTCPRACLLTGSVYV